MELKLGGTVGRSTYKPLTGAKLTESTPCAGPGWPLGGRAPKNSASPLPMRPLPSLIFASRWLQLPLYLGLILARAVYVFHFWVELVHLIEAAFGNSAALKSLVSSIGYKSDFEVT
eukprot:gene38089-49935_t